MNYEKLLDKYKAKVPFHTKFLYIWTAWVKRVQYFLVLILLLFSLVILYFGELRTIKIEHIWDTAVIFKPHKNDSTSIYDNLSCRQLNQPNQEPKIIIHKNTRTIWIHMSLQLLDQLQFSNQKKRHPCIVIILITIITKELIYHI